MTPVIAKRLIQQKGLSMSVAAAEIGVSRSTLYRWLRAPESIDVESIRRIVAWMQAEGGLAMDDRAAWEALDSSLLTLLPDTLKRQIVIDLVRSLQDDKA